VRLERDLWDVQPPDPPSVDKSGLEVARIFVMGLRLASVVPLVGRDAYLRGHGRMLGKLLDRITVVDGQR
jgi:hypothetical protein